MARRTKRTTVRKAPKPKKRELPREKVPPTTPLGDKLGALVVAALLAVGNAIRPLLHTIGEAIGNIVTGLGRGSRALFGWLADRRNALRDWILESPKPTTAQPAATQVKARQIVASQTAASQLKETKIVPTDAKTIDDIAKFAATAFALSGALLTFFGIKEGVLDKLLRTNPRPSIAIFCLLGLAFIVGTIAPIVSAAVLVRVLPIAVVLGGLAVFTLLVLPDFPADDQQSAVSIAVWGVVASFVAIGVLFFDLRLPLKAGLVLIAVGGLVFGLYGAAKVSVASKSSHEEPQITAEMQGTEDAPIAVVAVSAAKLKSSQFLSLTVTTLKTAASEAGTEVGSAVLRPDGIGSIQRTLRFSVGGDGTEPLVEVRGRKCKEPKADEDAAATEQRSAHEQAAIKCELKRKHRQVLFKIGSSTAVSFTGSVSAAAEGAKLELSLEGRNIPHDRLIKVVATRTGSDGAESDVVSSVLRPDAGAVKWTATVPSAAGSTTVLSYQLCDRDLKCDDGVEVAKLKSAAA